MTKDRSVKIDVYVCKLRKLIKLVSFNGCEVCPAAKYCSRLKIEKNKINYEQCRKIIFEWMQKSA